MPDMNQKPQSEFMIEKIKDRPVNKKKLMRRTLITAAMAVIFGLIACFTFLVLEPIISNWLYPEEEPEIVQFPEDKVEMSPEEMLSNTLQENSEPEQPSENVTLELEEEQIEEILSGVVLDKDNYRELYSALSDLVNELNESMVSVNCISSDVDWLNNVMESSNQVFGVIVANNGKELLILTNYTPIKKAERLTVTFYNKVRAQASIKQYDETTDLVILAVELSAFSQEQRENIKIAALGTSNIKKMEGTPVIALGSPMGINGSVGYGIIAGQSQVSVVDSSYKLLLTDIYGSQSAGGVLFNLQGQIIGVIAGGRTGSDMKNLIAAYGISDLRKLIEKMSNGSPVAYMGISGVDVSNEANMEWGVPFGAYVKDISKDSPAMLAGIQPGDVIVAIGDETVQKFSEYITILMGLEAGQTVDVTLMRQSQEEYKEMTLTITLGESGKED